MTSFEPDGDARVLRIGIAVLGWRQMVALDGDA
jgi:hypothetical protein